MADSERATPHAVEKDAAVFHLPGFPLPALISLASTQADTPFVDLFMLSLVRPVLLCTFGFPLNARGGGVDTARAAMDPSGEQLLSLTRALPRLTRCVPDLAVFGVSTLSPVNQACVHKALALPFPLLSDVSGVFASKLELPREGAGGETPGGGTGEAPSKPSDVPPSEAPSESQLRRCLLLLREGQVTRIDYPISQPHLAGSRAEEMLRRDSGAE
ncbi:hypothetical protein MSPP1_002362 [Malassezia sp. CBS 17886]|nr:hypothetical protein MSPP1_002362 [Malassezia sp. CBS 17886]